MKTRCGVVAAGAFLALCQGCGSGKPALHNVQGQVFYQGTTLARGVVVFTPDASRGNGGPLAYGEIQADGRYRLQTDGARGAAAGWYRVTVLSVEAPTGVPSGARYAFPRSLLPERYRDPDLSGLASEVKAGQENQIDFHLE